MVAWFGWFFWGGGGVDENWREGSHCVWKVWFVAWNKVNFLHGMCDCLEDRINLKHLQEMGGQVECALVSHDLSPSKT